MLGAAFCTWPSQGTGQETNASSKYVPRVRPGTGPFSSSATMRTQGGPKDADSHFDSEKTPREGSGPWQARGKLGFWGAGLWWPALGPPGKQGWVGAQTSRRLRAVQRDPRKSSCSLAVPTPHPAPTCSCPGALMTRGWARSLGFTLWYWELEAWAPGSLLAMWPWTRDSGLSLSVFIWETVTAGADLTGAVKIQAVL